MALRGIRRPRNRNDIRRDAIINQSIQSLNQGRYTLAEFLERMANMFRAPGEEMALQVKRVHVGSLA